MFAPVIGSPSAVSKTGAMPWPNIPISEKRIIVGGGTNLLFLSDFDGLIVSPDFSDIVLSYQDEEVVELTVGAGVDFDDFVAYCVTHGWYGVENLSLIPGKVGASPVQNIGAYGVEVADVVSRVNGLNLESLESLSLAQNQCHFGYRCRSNQSELP